MSAPAMKARALLVRFNVYTDEGDLSTESADAIASGIAEGLPSAWFEAWEGDDLWLDETFVIGQWLDELRTVPRSHLQPLADWFTDRQHHGPSIGRDGSLRELADLVSQLLDAQGFNLDHDRSED